MEWESGGNNMSTHFSPCIRENWKTVATIEKHHSCHYVPHSGSQGKRMEGKNSWSQDRCIRHVETSDMWVHISSAHIVSWCRWCDLCITSLSFPILSCSASFVPPWETDARSKLILLAYHSTPFRITKLAYTKKTEVNEMHPLQSVTLRLHQIQVQMCRWTHSAGPSALATGRICKPWWSSWREFMISKSSDVEAVKKSQCLIDINCYPRDWL